LSLVSCGSSAASIPTQPFSAIEGMPPVARIIPPISARRKRPDLRRGIVLLSCSVFHSSHLQRPGVDFELERGEHPAGRRRPIRVMDRTLKQLCISAAAFTLCLYILFTPLFYFLRREWIDPYEIQRRRESEREIERKVDSITEIYLARSGNCHPCPIYSVTFRKDGTAIYVGYENVTHLGTHHGKIHGYYFFRLAWLLDSEGFFQMRNEYSEENRMIAYAHWKEVSVRATRDGKKKEVWEYMGKGPINLWGIQMAIDAVVNKIEWRPNK
jgi:Domain of unknown function (DUF6438)